jgi:hypothetical protein
MNQKTENMKTMIKPLVVAMILVIAGNSAANAQRGMGRMMHDTIRMRMMMHDTSFMKKEGFPMMHMNLMNAPMYEQMCPGCRMGMYHGARGGMRPGMGWGYGPGFRHGIGPRQFNRPGFEGKPGIGRPENIPNLTDKQKKDIADLRLKQAEEVKKLREESMAKMKTLREDHRKKVMGLLTEEQKKLLEGNAGAPAQDIKKPQK